MHDQRSPVRWRPSIRRFAAAGVASFVVLTGFLGIRLAAGDDPALGDGRAQAQAQAKTQEAPDLSVSSVVSSLSSVIFDHEDGDDDGESSSSNPSTGSSGG